MGINLKEAHWQILGHFGHDLRQPLNVTGLAVGNIRRRTMPLLPADRIWNESNAIGEFGHVYEQNIQGKLPAMVPDALAMLVEMEGYRFMVRVRDRNNRLFLIGAPDEGLAFTSSGSSGTQSGLNGYDIRFFGQTRRRAYSYNPLTP